MGDEGTVSDSIDGRRKSTCFSLNGSYLPTASSERLLLRLIARLIAVAISAKTTSAASVAPITRATEGPRVLLLLPLWFPEA